MLPSATNRQLLYTLVIDWTLIMWNRRQVRQTNRQRMEIQACSNSAGIRDLYNGTGAGRHNEFSTSLHRITVKDCFFSCHPNLAIN